MSQKLHILIVDDEQQMLLAMETVLARLGHAVFRAANGAEAIQLLEKNNVDLIISDMKMPVMDGRELLANAKKQFPRIPFVMITAYGTIEQAVEAMRTGAYDFITKPFAAEDLERVVERIGGGETRREGITKTGKGQNPPTRAVLTNDPAFKRVIEIATTIAPSTASVLLQGESGTGKELLARLIHVASPRKDGPFVAINCAALPDNLLESELFGHEKGSFTGAVAAKTGKFELADGGTILLDEISEMDLSLQAKLLRVLQEREVDRVGGQKPIAIDVRVIATTNRDMRELVAKGKFREDLYYRLNVIPLYVPPLRERRGDVRLLLEHFVRNYSGNAPKKLTESVVGKLEQYSWPGNVRELQNACERAVLLAAGDELSENDFLLGSLAGGKDLNILTADVTDLTLRPGLSVSEAEKRLIYETLKSTGNNKTKAAELLGISIRTLRNKLNEYEGLQGDSDVELC